MATWSTQMSTSWGLSAMRNALVKAAEEKWGTKCTAGGPGVLSEAEVQKLKAKARSKHLSKHFSDLLKEAQPAVVRCNPGNEEGVGGTYISEGKQYCMGFGPNCTALQPVPAQVLPPNWARGTATRFLVSKFTRYAITIEKGHYTVNGKNKKTIPAKHAVCQMVFQFAFNYCKTCCCKDGLAKVYMDSSMSDDIGAIQVTKAKMETALPTSLIHPSDVFRCSEWFLALDTLTRAIFNIMRSFITMGYFTLQGPFSKQCVDKACKPCVIGKPCKRVCDMRVGHLSRKMYADQLGSLGRTMAAHSLLPSATIDRTDKTSIRKALETLFEKNFTVPRKIHTTLNGVATTLSLPQVPVGLDANYVDGTVYSGCAPS